MKKVTVLLLVLFILTAFTEIQGDALSDVTQRGVLRMGSSPEYIPFVFYDENGTMTGLDIALIEEVGRRMGVNVQTVDIAFDGLLDSLEIGQIDIIGRGISKTPAREELIDFSSVYYKGAAQFIALASLPKPAEVDQSCFSNRRIGVQKATSFEEWIRDNLVSGGYVDLTNVYLYSNAVDLMKGLDRGDVDLVIIDQDVYESLYQSTGDYQVFYEGFLEEDYAFGLQKGSTLTDVVNGHLEDMMKDGTAQQIADRFFSMDFSGDSTIQPTAVPTAAPYIPTQIPPAGCINGMTFVADVTIPDGSVVVPGNYFRKTWRVMNNGTCDWTPGYSFVFVGGDQMNGNNIIIPDYVAAGQTYDLSVDMVAPTDPGSYKGSWQMFAPTGLNFGETIWVNVVVGDGPQPVYPTPVPGYVNITSFYADSSSGFPEDCVTIYWSTEGASSADIYVDSSPVSQWNDPNGSMMLCNEVSGLGGHQIQLHAVSDASDAWADLQYTTMGHPTGLIVPTPEEEHATGLIVP